MTKTKKTLRICENGHSFYKSTDCPSCPACMAASKPDSGFLADLSNPARSALEYERIITVEKLAEFTEKEILSLHGVGPASLPTLRKALHEKNLDFKKP